MNVASAALATALLLATSAAGADMLTIDLAPDAGNPSSPQMGDNLSFHSMIRNSASAPADGVIVWLSLVQIDRGREQPVDLEDWSANKAVAIATLGAGGTLETDWPLRLIQAGNYRIVVSAMSRTGNGLVTSPFADFTVREKPVVQSERVLPVAIGLPLLLAAAFLWRRLK